MSLRVSYRDVYAKAGNQRLAKTAPFGDCRREGLQWNAFREDSGAHSGKRLLLFPGYDSASRTNVFLVNHRGPLAPNHFS